jgi:hypothetical protein
LLSSCRRLLVLSVVLSLAAGVSPEARAGQRMVKRLSKGVIYRVYEQRHPNLRIKTVTVHENRVSSIKAVLGSGQLPGWERTSSVARRTGAIVAINGDYGRPSGRPVMAFAHASRLIQTPLTAGQNFAVTPSSRARIGLPRPQLWMNAFGTNVPIDRLNDGGPYGHSLAMFDRAGGYLEKPPKRACSIRLMPDGFPRPGSEGKGIVAPYRVQRVKCSKGRLFPMGGRVISARWRTGKSDLLASVPVGATVWLGWTLGWGPVQETIGGNPALVHDGQVVVPKSRAPFFARHPRTGVGVTKDGRVILATVDGRQRRSIGMTLRGFARFFRSLGAVTALNLDGGGSTTMVVRGRVMNRPSDGSERPVSSALVVLPPGRDLDGDRAWASRSVSAWSAAAADPASTGGLAYSLIRSGADLSRQMKKAAHSFRRTFR